MGTLEYKGCESTFLTFLYLETVGISEYVSYLGNHLHTNYLTWFNSIDYYKLNEGEAQVFVAFSSLNY